MNTVLITGNTYPVKDQLKALGGKWDPVAKGWKVPASAADRAKALVGTSPQKARPTPRGRWTGCRCGSREDNPRDSDCASCQYDNE